MSVKICGEEPTLIKQHYLRRRPSGDYAIPPPHHLQGSQICGKKFFSVPLKQTFVAFEVDFHLLYSFQKCQQKNLESIFLFHIS